jgi:hypothetical protein
MIIGIYSLFIEKYIIYLDHFLKNINEKCLTKYKKKFFIVTNKKNEDIVKKYQATYDISYFLTEYIGWPYETLYKYFYFSFFNKNEIIKCKYIFLLNSNILFRKKCEDEILPDNRGYTFVLHRTQSNIKNTIESKSLEKNKKSTCYLSPRDNLKYIIGGFFGCETDKFIKLCKKLSNDIFQNERNNHIAIWHDETHLNYYVNEILKNNVKYLPIIYHGFGNSYNNKVDFIKKNLKSLKKPIKHRYGKIKKNIYNVNILL